MNATVTPDLSSADSTSASAVSAEEGGTNLHTLDFTRRPVVEILARTATTQTVDVPPLLNYAKWETWFDGFVAETASLPWSGRTMSASLSEFVKASVSGDEWRPDIVHPLKRAYEEYSSKVESNGFDQIGKSEFVELFIKELKVIPAKLYKNYLNKEKLEARARNFQGVAMANPGNSEIRKLRNLADTLALGRSKFFRETSWKNPENPCVKLRLAIDELSTKLEKSVRKPNESTSVLTTPVSKLVSRALAGFKFGK